MTKDKLIKLQEEYIKQLELYITKQSNILTEMYTDIRNIEYDYQNKLHKEKVINSQKLVDKAVKQFLKK